MKLRHIEIFRTLMLTRSVTRTAEELRTSQPTASRFLAELEAEIGFSLFIRGHGKMTPTPEAFALYEEVRRSYSGLDRIREVAGNIASFRHDRLRIASIPSVALGLLSKVIPRFCRRFGGIEVSLDVLSFDEVVRNVAANQCELGFVAYPVDRPGITESRLLGGRFVCAMPRGHPLERREVIRVEDLRDLPFISLGHNVPSRQRIDRIFEEAGVTRRMMLETQTAAFTCAFIKEGMGVSILDPFTVHALHDERLVARPFTPAVPFEFSAILRDQQPSQRVTHEFLAEMDRLLAVMSPAELVGDAMPEGTITTDVARAVPA